jgi:toxin FitB
MFLLDTNVVSELRKGKLKADVNVIAWAESLPATSLFISVVTVLELERGVLLLERRDAERGAVLRRWLDSHVMPSLSSRVLPIDSDVARRCARLHVPRTRSERDALIAATALVHSLTVATKSVSDFEPMGVDLLDPWALTGSRGSPP